MRPADSPPPERQRYEALLSVAHQFLRAYTLLKRDVDYVVVEDHVALSERSAGEQQKEIEKLHRHQIPAVERGKHAAQDNEPPPAGVDVGGQGRDDGSRPNSGDTN